MVYFVGANTLPFPQVVQTVRFNLGPITVSNIQLMILGISIFLMLALQFIVQKTKMGKAMRAVSVDSDAAQLMGLNLVQLLQEQRVYLSLFTITHWNL